MELATPRGHRPPRGHTATLITAATIGALLFTWYALDHATPGKLLFTGIILTGIGVATAVVMRRQCRIEARLDRVDAHLDGVDRQFAHVRMQYVAEALDDD